MESEFEMFYFVYHWNPKLPEYEKLYIEIFWHVLFIKFKCQFSPPHPAAPSGVRTATPCLPAHLLEYLMN